MLLQSLYFSRFLPNRPHPLSSFDTHVRWQPVTQSSRSRWSYGKIEDCEQSSQDHARILRTFHFAPACVQTPPPPPQIKNQFLLEKASVLATLHEPAELRRLRSIGHGLFIQPMRTTKCGVILCKRIRLRSMKWQERPEGDLHLSFRSLAIVGFLGSLNSLSIFSPMLPSWNRPKFKCPPITVNQSQLLFITNFNGEIMQSVQLFHCTVWILRDGCQPRFIQFAMPSTGWSNAVFRRAYYSYQSHLYFEATSLWLFTTQPIPIVGLLIS